MSDFDYSKLDIVKYVRKPFYIDAVRVTAENVQGVAKWADGEVRTDTDGSQYVKVRVHRPLNDRQTKAYVGDWVLFAGTGYKVYTPKAFANSFEVASVQPVDVTDLVEGTVDTAAIEAPKPAKKAVKKAS